MVALSILAGILSITGAVHFAEVPVVTLVLAVTAFVSSGIHIVYRDREYETLHTMLMFLCFWYGGPVSGLLSALILASGSVQGATGAPRTGVFHIVTSVQALLILPFALLLPRNGLPYPSPAYLLLIPILYLTRRLSADVPSLGRIRSLAFLGFLTNVPAVLLAVHLTDTFGPAATIFLCLLCILYLILVQRETTEIGRRTARLVRLTEHDMISRELLSASSLSAFIAAIETLTGEGLSFYEKFPDGWSVWTSRGCSTTEDPSSLPVSGPVFVPAGVPSLRITAGGEAAHRISTLFADEIADFGEQIARSWQVVSARIHQEEALFSVALLLARIADLKDRYTKMHSLRVADISTSIGRELGLSDPEINILRTGALLHDIGKVSLPSEILGKKGILTSRERMVIKSHPVEGAALVSGLSRFARAAETVLHHHERLDGSGYPTGLRGSAIPLHSRIVAVADTFDAITADRPYHPEVKSENALREIQAGRGTLYDARVVDALGNLVEKGAW
ncbi:MAG: HD-GYP domain-containing protein [Candidatus Fermentibacteraceae bacterium]